MYCVNCGVKLADSEDKCPLCGIKPYHPEIQRNKADKLFPPFHEQRVSKIGILLIMTAISLITIAVSFACNIALYDEITWSGYVAASVLLGYVIVILPVWFKKINAVIFSAIDVLAIISYLLYINCAVNGKWFLSFAFPVAGIIGCIFISIITLCKYIRRGYLYIFGGALISLGLSMLFIEFMLNLTFNVNTCFVWSFYPLAALSFVGLLLIIIAICTPLREYLHKKFFI